ncbi:MAG TPA: GAF domain-containing sensor histidine kinase [Egibacteraceae bacterium]|nr:GAF domain-containing sensor histidine kinase [Egibacteraceae bacterium]
METAAEPLDCPPTTRNDAIEVSAALAEPARLRALRRLRLLDTPGEEAFDRLVRMAHTTLGVPVALITLVDEDRQFFKACIGLPEPWQSRRVLPLTHSFCQYAVATGQELVVEDATQHPFLASNLAIDDLRIVAYAGVPVRSVDGHTLGTFCIADSVPRRWTGAELALVREFAAVVTDLVEAHLALVTTPQRQAVLSQLVEAQEEERRRIAAEIHDDTIQTLVAVSVRLQLLAEQRADDGGGETTLKRLATAATAATDRLRRLVVGLRPTSLDRGALASAIDEHAKLVLGDGVPVHLDVACENLPPAVATTLFRIAQETIANVRAHADATRVWIRIRQVHGGVELRVRDDGHGFSVGQTVAGHYGLSIMQERAELLGGSMEVLSAPGEGADVRAWLPLSPQGER